MKSPPADKAYPGRLGLNKPAGSCDYLPALDVISASLWEAVQRLLAIALLPKAERGDVDSLPVSSQALFPECGPTALPDVGHR